MNKLFSVLIGCYGDYPEYSLRAVGSIIGHNPTRSEFDVIVGCNECSNEVLAVLRKYFDRGHIDFLVESRHNVNKDPMMRVMLSMCRTPYILWLDDDSHVLPNWDLHILEFLRRESPFDVAGHVFYINERSDQHLSFLRSRSWYHSPEREQSPIWFATGGLFLANVAFLRKHDFPDDAMVKRADDVLLGELCQQQQARLVDFGCNREIMDRIRVSDGNRRGNGEGADGWVFSPQS